MSTYSVTSASPDGTNSAIVNASPGLVVEHPSGRLHDLVGGLLLIGHVTGDVPGDRGAARHHASVAEGLLADAARRGTREGCRDGRGAGRFPRSRGRAPKRNVKGRAVDAASSSRWRPLAAVRDRTQAALYSATRSSTESSSSAVELPVGVLVPRCRCPWRRLGVAGEADVEPVVLDEGEVLEQSGHRRSGAQQRHAGVVSVDTGRASAARRRGTTRACR